MSTPLPHWICHSCSTYNPRHSESCRICQRLHSANCTTCADIQAAESRHRTQSSEKTSSSRPDTDKDTDDHPQEKPIVTTRRNAISFASVNAAAFVMNRGVSALLRSENKAKTEEKERGKDMDWSKQFWESRHYDGDDSG